jgi:HlyD family secretion protein
MDLELGKMSGSDAGRRRPSTWKSLMPRAPWPTVSEITAGRRWILFGVLASLSAAAAAAPGCSHQAKVANAAKPPTVRVIRPEVRNIVRVVGQPSFIESYERTSIYAKPAAFIEKWIVDIGDKVKKDQVLATLFVPELVEDHKTKAATVELDRERIAMAKEVVGVAGADVKAAEGRFKEATAMLGKYEAEVVRWDLQVKRLRGEVAKVAVDPRILGESEYQLKSSIAARDFAKATIKRTDAEVLSRKAALVKAEVDVKVAEADLKVAESEERRLKAWVGYLTLTAPYDGVITARNANTFDFVLPARGDPSANYLSPGISPSGNAAPIYVVDRTDVVRVFVDVPEQDANYIHIGTKATVLAKGYRDEPIPATVTRTSWALNEKSRTLRAEVDLKNPGTQLLPGMYAYVKLIIDRPGVRALPESALNYVDDRAFCWTYENGRAVRTEVRTGVADGEWIEVTNRQVPPVDNAAEPWVPIDGKEQVIVGDQSLLVDGQPVEIAPEADGPKLASGAPNEPIGPAKDEL